ncbi:hypothetical protein ABZ690_36285, partial [Streptomyces sp. NPDC006967]
MSHPQNVTGGPEGREQHAEDPAQAGTGGARVLRGAVRSGATGFVGTLTAEYLAGHAPAGLRWAIAGR